MTTPEPIDSSDDQDELLHGLHEVRVNLALNERMGQIAEQLSDDWEAWRTAKIDGKATGLSPVAQLKLEALASIAALSDFHCSVAHQLIDAGMHDAAHGWTLDEGALNVAFDVLNGVNTRDI
jgi:hypothetical protein